MKFNLKDEDRQVAFAPADIKLQGNGYVAVDVRSGEIVPFEGEYRFDVKAHGSRLLSICEDKPHTVLDCNFKVLDTRVSKTSLILETQYPAHAEMLLNGKVATVTFNGKALPWKQEGARLLFELPGKGELEITWDK